MIQRLLIKNYAIIEELEIDFSKQFTIITGETGAGKSILLGALGLVMGKRADTKVLYFDDKKCIVEAYFEISKYNIKEFFDIHDIDYDDELVIRREITPSGKTRAFVNDTPVNLKILQQLSASLLDLHQQFDTLDIHRVSFQLRMIDALAGNNEKLIDYRKLFKNYQSNKKKLAELILQSDNAAKEMDFLRFQLEEFNEIELVEGEQLKMESEQSTLSNAEEIKKILGDAFRHISENDQSILNQLQSISFSLSGISDFDPKLHQLHQRFEGILEELQDLANEFEKKSEETEYNAEAISEIQDRLDIIYKLQNKHRVKTIKELITIQSDLKNSLTSFDDLSKDIENLEKTIQKEEIKLQKIASVLSKRRKSVVNGFEKNVHHLLGQLSMEHAQIRVEVNDLNGLNATGKDEVEFMFAPNKGSKFLPIKDVASGGELSRLTLCTKSLVADAIPLPTLIFDEIDTGISGDVALKMGNILRELSARHQIVSITHTPQIAVKADVHYFVYKKTTTDRTITKVKLLSTDERVRSVATMLSGSPPSDSAIENAKELLAQ